jgi:hypothetical protein
MFTGDTFLIQLVEKCSTNTAGCNGGSFEGLDGDLFSRSNRIVRMTIRMNKDASTTVIPLRRIGLPAIMV